MTLPKVSENEVIQSQYELLRANGESHSMAEILAFRSPPYTKGEQEFKTGFCWNDRDASGIQDIMTLTKRQAPNFSFTGKRYVGGIAKTAGDPRAWVDEQNMRTEIKKVCEERGWEAQGMIEHSPTVKDEHLKPKEYRVSDKIVDREAAALRQSNPKLSVPESKEITRAQITPKNV